MDHLKESNVLQQPLTDFEHLLSNESSSRKGILPKLYKLLITTGNSDIQNFQNMWQEDLGFELQNSHWESIWESPANKTNIFNICL